MLRSVGVFSATNLELGLGSTSIYVWKMHYYAIVVCIHISYYAYCTYVCILYTMHRIYVCKDVEGADSLQVNLTARAAARARARQPVHVWQCKQCLRLLH